MENGKGIFFFLIVAQASLTPATAAKRRASPTTLNYLNAQNRILDLNNPCPSLFFISLFAEGEL